MIAKLISGGQSGVDIAALLVAKSLGIPTGGWMPKGFLTENGPRPEYATEFGLRETDSSDYAYRTACNVDEADAVLILTDRLPVDGGTRFTVNLCKRHKKRWDLVDLRADNWSLDARLHDVKLALADMLAGDVLMVAGPRESKSPGIYERARAVLLAVLVPEEPT